MVEGEDLSAAAILTLEWQGAEAANDSLRRELIPACKPYIDSGARLEITVRLATDSQTRKQQQRLHAMCRDISKQVQLYGKTLPPESWKRVLIDAFRHETKHELADEWGKFGEIELVPALNHPGFVMVGEQSRRFSRKLSSAFIEWLLAFGAEKNVIWTDPKFLAWAREVGLIE